MVLRLRSDVDYVIALGFGVGVAKGRLGLGAVPEFSSFLLRALKKSYNICKYVVNIPTRPPRILRKKNRRLQLVLLISLLKFIWVSLKF